MQRPVAQFPAAAARHVEQRIQAPEPRYVAPTRRDRIGRIWAPVYINDKGPFRLVLDTGMHYLGWTRKQAIDFMANNTGLSIHNIEAEVDRYISWPGQALAYKTGELKIRELRAKAETELGDAFDIRSFHEVVLGSGAIPLDVLSDNVERYIAETLASGSTDASSSEGKRVP